MSSQGDPRIHALLTRIGEVHDQKQRDYGTDTDPFANVRGAEEWGVPAWVGAMIRANDKIRRIQQYARTGTLANEGVEDSFIDLAVYALIAHILWAEETNKPKGGIITADEIKAGRLLTNYNTGELIENMRAAAADEVSRLGLAQEGLEVDDGQ